MPVEPAVKRALTFIDGQNLFHSARLAFGYTYPNYDVRALADRLCRMQGWQSSQVRFYTGIPASSDDPRWYHFWSAKLAMMGRQGIHVYSRPLRYRTKTVRLSDGEMFTFVAGEEKGVDVRIALDVIRLAHRAEYDVALLFSQDQDLSEGCRGGQDHFQRAAALAQNCLRFPIQLEQPESAGHRQDRLDSDRPGHLRCLPGSPGLPDRRLLTPRTEVQ